MNGSEDALGVKDDKIIFDPIVEKAEFIYIEINGIAEEKLIFSSCGGNKIEKSKSILLKVIFVKNYSAIVFASEKFVDARAVFESQFFMDDFLW